MSRVLGVVLVVVLCAGVSSAQQPKTEKLVLELLTKTMAMPFKMPVIPNMPNLPNMPKFGEPQRIIRGEANYPTQAVEPIFVSVPADLKLAGNKLVLTVPKPMTAPPGPAAGPGGQKPPGGKFEFTSNLYWHPDTAEGPITHTIQADFSGAGPGPGRMGPQAPRFNVGPLVAIEKTATGEESKLPAAVIGNGQYVLNTGGTAALDGFLSPIKVTQPESLAEVDLAQGIDVEWEAVTGARGYILHAMGMEGALGGPVQATKITLWVSTLQEPPQRVQQDYEQATTIADDLRDGILLPATATACKVPPNVFTGKYSMFILTVTAVGNDFYSVEDGITVRGKIRAEWQGMKMAMMMGMPGMPAAAGGAQE